MIHSTLDRRKIPLLFSNSFEELPVTEKPEEAPEHASELPAVFIGENCPCLPEVGAFSNIGDRKDQQDSYGYVRYGNGIFAAVADGMGGLKEGGKVSRGVIEYFIRECGGDVSGDDALYRMLASVNFRINRLLGRKNLRKSGSTLVAVMTEEDNFRWISVGDSHIYLFRGEKLLLLNREHIYRSCLLLNAVNGKAGFDEIDENVQKDGLTSFIGMGDLACVDGSQSAVPAKSGDMLLLVSDGVYNALDDALLEKLMNSDTDIQGKADKIGQAVLDAHMPQQDNFTVLIVGI